MRADFLSTLLFSIVLISVAGCETTRPQDYNELDGLLNPGVAEVESAPVAEQLPKVAEIPVAVSAVEVAEGVIVPVAGTAPVVAEDVVVIKPQAVSAGAVAQSPVTATPAPAPVIERSHPQAEDDATDVDDEMALGERAVFQQGETSVRLASAEVGKHWTFDVYGGERTRREAIAGKRYVTARLTVSSANKNPALFGIGVYAREGRALRLVGRLGYRFARWREQAAYLGNYPDGMNDFAVTREVPFSLGVLVSELDARQPLYLVATGEGCHERQHDPYAYPTESYPPLACPSLKKVLKVQDFRSGRLAVLKCID